MRKWFLSLLLLLILVETFSLLPVPREKRGPIRNDAIPTAIGIIDLTFDKNQAGEQLKNIYEQASQNDIDFVILAGTEGKSPEVDTGDSVDIYPETEIQTPFGHCLVFGSTKNGERKNCFANDSEVFFASNHPRHPNAPWTRVDKFANGTEAVSVETLWSDLVNDSPFYVATTLLWGYLNPYLGSLRFLRVSSRDLSAWDSGTSLSSRYFGFLGSSSETLPSQVLNEFQSRAYQRLFRIGANAVFLEKPLQSAYELRRQSIYRSIRKGALAVFSPVIHPFNGNRWTITCSGTTGTSGSEVHLGGTPCRSQVRLPRDLPFPSTIKIIRNGEKLLEVDAKDPVVETPLARPGTYRAEIWVHAQSRFRLAIDDDVPYVLYNPIYVDF